MQILIDGVDRVPEGVATAVSVGAYDGIHLGHRKVLGAVAALAKEQGLATAVVSFDQHPAAIVRPESAPLLLTDHEQRVALFDEIGIDYLFLLRFDQRRADTSDRDFVADVLVDRLNAKVIAVGSDFHFGKGRSGSVESLRELGQEMNFEVRGLELLTDTDHEVPVSSTAIRAALAASDIAGANAMLGRKYEVRGTVVKGDHRAHSIGFPTANIAYQPGRAWPANGVYAAMVTLPDGQRRPAAVNIGLRPTFYDDADFPLLEVHVLDFDGDLYGDELRVEFCDFLRGEQKFAGIEEIAAQLQRDIANARAVLSA